MIKTAENLKDINSVEVDICIIGSGAGGSMAAFHFSKQGHDVLVLEEGRAVSRKDFDQDSSRLVPMLYRRGAGLATDDLSIRILQGTGLGGSTTINWMTSLRTPDFVLEQWNEYFGLENYLPKSMEEHFNSVEQRMNVHTHDIDEISPQNRILLDGFKELNVEPKLIPTNSKNCIGCGTCGLGCPYDAKQDMRITYLKDAQEAGANIFTDTRADRIDYVNSKTQIIDAIVLHSRYGGSDKALTIKAKRTIVAASAISTPLLLQKSGLTRSKAVGKFLTIHPVTVVVGIYDRIIDPSYGIPQTVTTKEFLNMDGRGYGYWLEAPDLEPFLMGVNFPSIGTMRRADLKDFRKLGAIIVLVRDGANLKSNGEVRWRRGYNRQSGHMSLGKIPSIRYNLSKPDKTHLLMGLEKSIETHFAAKAKRVLTLHNKYTEFTHPDQRSKIWDLKNGPNQLSLFSAHPLGTARMGTDLKTSVIDETMQMHHYPGMYVMDGSAIPTALGVNPMITILSTVSRAIQMGNLDL